MNKIATIVLSFTAGAVAGFTVAQFVKIETEEKNVVVSGSDIMKKKEEESKQAEAPAQAPPIAPKVDIKPILTPVDPAEYEHPQDDDPEQLISTGPAHIAMPGKPGVNYAKVQQIVKENGYTTTEEIQQVIDDPDNEETYEERVEREQVAMEDAMSEYRKKNKDKIVPITRDEWDSDFPEVDYDKKDLYYFTTDGVLTDDNGNHLDIEEYLGTKPAQFGWFENAEERLYIRNNPKETDFVVWKEQCKSEEWW